MKIWDANLVHRILKFKQSAIDTALGINQCSGASIYVPSEITEDVKFNVTFEKVPYTISIESATKSIVNLDDHFKNADNTTSQNLINIVIKQAFRQTDLKQIGKSPKFFDVNPKNTILLSELNLKIVAGFKASAF